MRARSPSSAPPEILDDGSTARTATVRPSWRHVRTSSESSEDLPTPGGPVTPTTCAGASPPSAAGATACRSAAIASSCPGARLSTRFSTDGAALRSPSRNRRPRSSPLAGIAAQPSGAPTHPPRPPLSRLVVCRLADDVALLEHAARDIDQAQVAVARGLLDTLERLWL